MPINLSSYEKGTLVYSEQTRPLQPKKIPLDAPREQILSGPPNLDHRGMKICYSYS